MAFMMPPSTGFAYNPDTNGCLARDPIYYTGVTLVVIQAGLIGGLLYRARKAESCFHEFRDFAIISGVAAVAGIAALALRIVAQSTGKLVLTGVATIAVVCLSQQVYFWLIMGRTVYNCARHPEKFQRDFVEKIDANGMSEVYEMACRYPLGEISSMSDAGRSRNVSARQSGATAGSRFSGNIPAPESASQPQGKLPAEKSGEALIYYGT
ncbi:hypothetical protein IWW57_001402 [Coemansia sp. S610]|nr:hypothetical protein IWW57_001402 [Coemansia sp. S610]KAJ2700554.1 hypothetical protein H4218_001974 [Coemansia sp. IMI 209128]